MLGEKYETVNTKVEYKETLHPDAHMSIFQELIEEVHDVEAFIMTQLYLKASIKCWKGKRRSADKYDMKQLHLRDTSKPKHYRYLN